MHLRSQKSRGYTGLKWNVCANTCADSNGTAWMQTSQTGAHTLQACGSLISLVCLAGGNREQADTPVSDKCWSESQHLLAAQPETRYLPEVCQNWMLVHAHALQSQPTF